MRSPHFAFTLLIALGSSTPASGEDAARVHPTDGLPPIGDHGASHGYNGNGCEETYETLSLTLDHVTIDGVDGPLVTDVQGTSVPASEITKSDLSTDTTETGYVDFDLNTGVSSLLRSPRRRLALEAVERARADAPHASCRAS